MGIVICYCFPIVFSPSMVCWEPLPLIRPISLSLCCSLPHLLVGTVPLARCRPPPTHGMLMHLSKPRAFPSKGVLLQLEELEPFPSRCVGAHIAAQLVVLGLANMRKFLPDSGLPPPLFLPSRPHRLPLPYCHPHRPSHNLLLRKQTRARAFFSRSSYVHGFTDIHTVSSHAIYLFQQVSSQRRSNSAIYKAADLE